MGNIFQNLNSQILVIWGDWDLISGFWGKLIKNGLSGITLQTHIRFSQTSPHFVKRLQEFLLKQIIGEI